MRPLIYKRSTWHAVLKQIKQDYPPSVYLIRSKMREVLGFTVREHHHFDTKRRRYIDTIMLDFYEEKFKSLFLLKYGHISCDYSLELE